MSNSSILSAILTVTGNGRNETKDIVAAIVNNSTLPPIHETITVSSHAFYSLLAPGVTGYSWVIIIPTGSNSSNAWLKGVSGDTGFSISSTTILPINSSSQISLYNNDGSNPLTYEVYFV